MSNHTHQPNRIPAEELTDIKTWRIPVIDDHGNVVPSAEKEHKEALEEQRRAEQETIETVEMPEQVSAGISAQEMQEIFDSAERDGFEQGHKQGVEQGHKEGYEAGQQQGLLEMRQSLTASQQRFESLANALLNPMQEQDQAIETMLLEAIVTLTKSVVARELATDTSEILQVVQQAVDALPVGSKNIRISLNPDDLESINDYMAKQHLDWELRANESISAGGCLVETQESRVDFSIEKRLNTVLEQFMARQLATSHSPSNLDDDAISSTTTSLNPSEPPAHEH